MTTQAIATQAMAFFLLTVVDIALAAPDNDFMAEAEIALGLCRIFLEDFIPPNLTGPLIISPVSGNC